MSLRLGERGVTPVYENRLAITPVSTDCLGDACRIAAKVGRCFIDLHHIYHPGRAYLNHDNPLYARLRNDPLNVLPIARCRHEDEHDRYRYTQFPPKDVVVQFLAESEFLQSLGVHVKHLAMAVETIEKSYAQEEKARPEQMQRFLDIHVPLRSMTLEWAERHDMSFQDGLQLVPALEVIPGDIVARTLNNMLNTRAQLGIEGVLQAA